MGLVLWCLCSEITLATKTQKHKIPLKRKFVIHSRINTKKQAMKRAIILIYVIVFIPLSNCIGQDQNQKRLSKDNYTKNEYLVQATLWYQRSAEMRAIYYQAFNLAKMVLDDKLMRIRLSKPAAIVFDIDETLLDNSPYETESIRTGNNYSKELWMEWTAMEKANALPGAVDFVNHAQEKGVEVFYISNRYHEELSQTINNLKKQGFPNADTTHVLLRKDRSDKTSRRNFVSENHTIVMIVGDNLCDFKQEFANRGEDLGFNLVDEHKSEFGSAFIILPNPMYGEWVKEINRNKYDLPDEEKMAIIIQNVVGKYYPGSKRYYPDFSGVAQSYNYYPVPPITSDNSIVHIALGLGKAIVEGYNAVRFSPEHPQNLHQFSTINDFFVNYLYSKKRSSGLSK